LAQSKQQKIIMLGYDWVGPGALGHYGSVCADGPVSLINRLNTELVRALPPGSFFLDLTVVSGMMGRNQFYDVRNYHWTKQPFSKKGLRVLADHLVAATRAMTVGPKKVVVLDLDNTLWGGVVGETGPLGIMLGEGPDGEAFLAFQQYLLGLNERGILLAVCSKNELKNAEEAFQSNPNMLLEREHFADFRANWNPKSENLRMIAQALNLGLNSFVFVDDNPREREEVRSALPEVTVIELPQNPSDYVRALEESLLFETSFVTSDDSARSKAYALEAVRRTRLHEADSLDTYLQNLQMKARISEIGAAELPRVVQLLGKTNQFNFSTRRHGAEVVKNFAATEHAYVRCLSLSDQFGDLGIVSVLFALPVEENGERVLSIDSWIMSCRVFQRSVEFFFFSQLLHFARQNGFDRIVGDYIPTPKNVILKPLIAKLGFDMQGPAPDGAYRLRRCSTQSLDEPIFVSLV
jgi:FkbH-like protein